MTQPPENPPPEKPSPSTQLPRNSRIPNYRKIPTPLTSRQTFLLALAGFLAFFLSIAAGIPSFFLTNSFLHLLQPYLALSPGFAILAYPAPTFITLALLLFLKSRWHSAPLTGFLIAFGLSPLLCCGICAHTFNRL